MQRLKLYAAIFLYFLALLLNIAGALAQTVDLYRHVGGAGGHVLLGGANLLAVIYLLWLARGAR